jgi:hypothetical protein
VCLLADSHKAALSVDDVLPAAQGLNQALPTWK